MVLARADKQIVKAVRRSVNYEADRFSERGVEVLNCVELLPKIALVFGQYAPYNARALSAVSESKSITLMTRVCAWPFCQQTNGITAGSLTCL